MSITARIIRTLAVVGVLVGATLVVPLRAACPGGSLPACYAICNEALINCRQTCPPGNQTCLADCNRRFQNCQRSCDVNCA